MTLRINYNELTNKYDVEYFADYRNAWSRCDDFYNGSYNNSFKTREEAEQFINWKNEQANRQASIITIPANYYNNYNRYYGD